MDHDKALQIEETPSGKFIITLKSGWSFDPSSDDRVSCAQSIDQVQEQLSKTYPTPPHCLPENLLDANRLNRVHVRNVSMRGNNTLIILEDARGRDAGEIDWNVWTQMSTNERRTL